MSVISDAVKHGHDISICGECARNARAQWPQGHVATFHEGECRECGKVTAVCATSDWDWSGKAGRLMRMRREI